MNNVIGITVCYNTPDMIKNAIESVLKFNPELKIMIIDNSPSGSECYFVVDNLCKRYKNVMCYHTEYNIGHGEALHLGISLTSEKYILVFDSDIIMKRSPINEMIGQMAFNIYGIGQIVQSDLRGRNVEKGINYLHPYFCLLNRVNYDKFRPYFHHGAPALNAMIDLSHKRGCKLIDFDLSDYVIHLERGTRNILNGKEAENLRA